MAEKTQLISLDRLWMGESNTAPWAKMPGQLDEVVNCRLDITMPGLPTRNPAQMIDLLAKHASGDDFDPTQSLHWLNIDNAVIAIGSGKIWGWSTSGVPLEIIDNSHGTFYAYVTSSDPKARISSTSSYDTAIILNRDTAPASEDAWSFQESENFLANGSITSSSGTTAPTSGANVDTVSDLPTGSPDGEYRYVRLDEELDPSGWYLNWTGAVHASAVGWFTNVGTWYRVPRGDQARGQWTGSTMPHRVTYSVSAGTLTLDKCPWKHRLSGKPSGHPVMPLTNRIRAIEFHSGRLFLLTDERVCSSRHDDYFNLWDNNVNAISDSDRIISNITQSNMGRVLRAKSTSGTLFIECERGQLEYSSGLDALTNSNGRTMLIGSFMSEDIQPAATGGSVFAIDKMGDVHQWSFANSATSAGLGYVGAITAHRNKLLDDKTVVSMACSGRSLFLVMEDGDVLFHDQMIAGDQMLQSAWGRIVFNDECLFVHSRNNGLGVVMRDADDEDAPAVLCRYAHRHVPPPTGMLYMPRLDRLELVDPGDMTYSEADQETSMSHTGRSGDIDKSFLVVTDGNNKHLFVKAKRIEEDGSVVFDGEWNTAGQYLGFTFRQSATWSRAYLQATAYEFMLQKAAVFHSDTTDYTIRWSTSGQQHEKSFSSNKVGVSRIGEASFATGHFEFGIAGPARKMTLTLIHESPGQCIWNGIELEGTYEGRGTTG